jgi:hypothetical protein
MCETSLCERYSQFLIEGKRGEDAAADAQAWADVICPTPNLRKSVLETGFIHSGCEVFCIAPSNSIGYLAVSRRSYPSLCTHSRLNRLIP